MKYIHHLLSFGYHQAMSCLFPVIIFLTLAVSKFIPGDFIARYDFILLVCLIYQLLFLVTRLETFDEFKVICLFHVIGLALELYKVHMGSWAYPEEAWSKIAGVPLYSGFMYASVASYMCQAWRRMDLQLVNWPNTWMVTLVAAATYFNFFTHHYMWDLRWVLKAVILLLFFRTFVTFTIQRTTYRMPLSLSFVLIGFFIWIAENIVTFFGAWQYPNQQAGWQLVHVSKISSWLLLVIVSFLAVALLKHVKNKELTEMKDKNISFK
ncbi:DUF817 domain-containing protein [Bacillus sp. CECT 9360]|uniref:DUF817 domain-containing protein n=1 Tax=Bacillus sp. CECT 9360 TaxID=2845821 RepID=UPI001E2F1B62|nr:DUF817 domain-containing protein [Bacillus sp. CECT 9360]CAH0344605.1 hypothetical protein BCI9360_00865 [Bacillus sp. CECT 9360]